MKYRLFSHGIILILFIGIVLSIPSYTAFSQKTVLFKGTVTDSETLEPLKFVTIRLIGVVNKAAVTSKEGTYLLRVPKGEYDITYSMVGYTSEKKHLSIVADTLIQNVALQRSSFRSAEIIVSAEDPGVKLMRSVLQKKMQWTDSLKNYTYMLYTKFVVSADTVTAGRNSGRNDTSIFSILESYSKGYFEKPDKYFNEIIQKRQTANIPPQANFVAFGTNLNVYDDKISFFNEDIFTPFHPNALDYYEFTLVKTFQDDTKEIAEIRVEPKSGQRRLFNGTINIDKQALIPLYVDLKPNRAVKLPFDASLHVQQTFIEIDSHYAMPSSLRIFSSLNAEVLFLFAPRLDISIENVAYEYEINTDIPPEKFDQRRVEINDKANSFDSIFWIEKAILPLKPEETAAYIQIQQALEDPDSTATSAFNSLFGDISAFFNRLAQRPFTGFEDMFRYNRVHGVYGGIGLQFQHTHNAESGIKLGYGFSDNYLYTEAFYRQYLNETKKYIVECNAYRKLSRRDNPYVVGQSGITSLSVLFKSDYGDYYYNQGAELSFEYGWGQLKFLRREEFIRPSAIKFSIKREFHSSAHVNTQFALFAPSESSFRDNPPVLSGEYTIASAEFRMNFTPIRRISTAGFIISGQYAIPGISAKSYSQSTFQAFLRTVTLPLWRLDARISGGYSWGDIPPQKFFSLESSIASTAGDGVFRGMNVKEFYGDRYAALSLEHNFGEVIPGVLRIPSIASFGIEFILTGSIGYTEFSRNALVIKPLPSTSTTNDMYYYEAGIALNKIFLFFRCDLSGRFSQRSDPELRFTISGSTF